MATRAEITQEMMEEFGKSSPDVRVQVERVVGEITVDILSQNDCRFHRLSAKSRLTGVIGATSSKLPGDFAATKPTFREVDVDGEFVAEREICDENLFYGRMNDADYEGLKYSYVEYRPDGTSGPGDYLVFADAFTETTYFDFPYYRKPTPDDTDIILNIRAVKEGVRSAFPEYTAQAANSLVIYEKMKSGIGDSPILRATHLSMEPSKRVKKHNRFMRKIGRGL